MAVDLSREQLYNFVKVKSSQVVLDFNHDPAKNANSVILKTGVIAAGNGPPGNSNANLVQAGLIYYFNDGEWTQTKFDDAAGAGSGYLLGIGLGRSNNYDTAATGDGSATTGSPTEVGMLLRGVTWASVFSSGGTTPGQPIYGSASKYGRLRDSPPGGGNYAQVLGWALDSDPNSGGTLILFDPQYPMSGTL